MSVLMSLGNAFGLTATVLFLGYGLVNIPKWMLERSNYKKQLMRLEQRAPREREKLLEAERNLKLLVGEIRNLPEATKSMPELSLFVNVLGQKVQEYNSIVFFPSNS